MACKIDTKETFKIITPNSSNLDSNLAVELTEHLNQSEQSGQSAIIDFQFIDACSLDSVQFLSNWHHQMYQNNVSFVLTHVPDVVKSKLAESDGFDTLNITPTLIEAIDIVAMEDIERELLGEE